MVCTHVICPVIIRSEYSSGTKKLLSELANKLSSTRQLEVVAHASFMFCSTSSKLNKINYIYVHHIDYYLIDI